MEQITFAPTLEVVSELTDRCDRCGFAAQLVCTLAGGDLAFCGHHANKNADSILRNAVAIEVVTGFSWRGAASTNTAGAPVSTVEDSEPSQSIR
jgi:hypothetical protein